MENNDYPNLSNYNRAFGFLLIILLIALYDFFNPTYIKEEDTRWINVELSTSAIYKKTNGDDAPEIILRAKGFDKKFDISGCALYRIDKSALLVVAKGEKLSLQVDISDLESPKRKFIYNPITVYGVKLSSRQSILSLDRYNQCENDNWKNYLLVAIFPVALIIYTFISNLRARNKKS